MLIRWKTKDKDKEKGEKSSSSKSSSSSGGGSKKKRKFGRDGGRIFYIAWRLPKIKNRLSCITKNHCLGVSRIFEYNYR